MLAPFAISVLIYDQDALLARSSSARALFEQQFEAALVYLPRVPPRLREEPLQALRFPSLGSDHGLGVGQGGEGLVAFGRQQEPLKIASETFTLGASVKEIVKACCVLFQRTGSGLYGQSSGHGGISSLCATIGAQRFSYFNKVPLQQGPQLLTQTASMGDAAGHEVLFRRFTQKDRPGRRSRRYVQVRSCSRLFGVSLSSVKRYLRLAERGMSLAPRKGGGRPPKIDQTAQKLLEEDVKERPAATVSERRRFLEHTTGKALSASTVKRLLKRLLKRLGFSRKNELWGRWSETSG